MSSGTDKDKKTPPAQAQAAAPKAVQARPKPSAPVQQKASNHDKPEPAAPAFGRRRVWPD